MSPSFWWLQTPSSLSGGGISPISASAFARPLPVSLCLLFRFFQGLLSLDVGPPWGTWDEHVLRL